MQTLKFKSRIMPTSRMAGFSWPALTFGLLVLICTIALSTSGKSKAKDGSEQLNEISFDAFKKSVEASTLECYVCNSLVGDCNPGKKVKCATEYFTEVYGKTGVYERPATPGGAAESGGTPPQNRKRRQAEQAPGTESGVVTVAPEDGNGDGGGTGGEGGDIMRQIPYALSKTVKTNPVANDSGWVFSNFPNSFTDKPQLDNKYGYSSWQNWHLSNNDILKNGFQSCRQMKITVEDQKNEGRRGEIPTTHQRIIRTCSFAEVKTNTDKWDANGCKYFNYKSSAVEVCHCSDTLCNGTSYLRISHWIITASLLVLFIQFVRSKK